MARRAIIKTSKRTLSQEEIETMTTTKTCTRCNGEGKYSFNLKDGDVCYGCGGAGKVAVTAKGGKVKATSTIHKAKVGDTVEQVNIYRIIDIKDVVDPKANSTDLSVIRNHTPYNQKLTGQNIVSGKYAYFYRYQQPVEA
jgi:hypothetical protein